MIMSKLLEEQVTSIELCQNLQALGVTRASTFCWSNVDTPYPQLVLRGWSPERSGDFLLPTYTTSEHLDVLPNVINGYGVLKLSKALGNNDWICSYDNGNVVPDVYFIDPRLQNALAKLRCYLIADGRI